MTDLHDREDRFGVPVQRIINVMKAHRGLIRDGCYVPTRGEVATWPADRLWWHLLGWWHESPTELIPTDEQVAAVVEILRQRDDADSPERRSSRKRRRLRTANEGTRTRTVRAMKGEGQSG